MGTVNFSVWLFFREHLKQHLAIIGRLLLLRSNKGPQNNGTVSQPPLPLNTHSGYFFNPFSAIYTWSHLFQQPQL